MEAWTNPSPWSIGNLFLVLRNNGHFPGLAETDATQPAEKCLHGPPEMANCVCVGSPVTTTPLWVWV